MNILRKNIILGVLASLLWSSCGEDAYIASPDTARIKFFNGAYNADAAVSLDGTRMSFLTSVRPDTLKYTRTFPTDSTYIGIDAGARIIKLASPNGATSWLETNVSAEKGKNYSVFVADTLGKVNTVVLEDVMLAPKTNVAIVRVLNLLVNAQNVDVVVSSGGFSFPGIANKKSSAFSEIKIDTAAQKINLQVVKAGTNTALATLSAQTMSAGRAYTLVVTGFADSTGAKAPKATWVQHAR